MYQKLMYQKLMYRKFTTADGLTGVEVRTWHPGWWIPYWKNKIVYWLGAWQRYKSHTESLAFINEILNENVQINKITEITAVIQCVECGFECGHVEPYGFVPEDGCPIHNV